MARYMVLTSQAKEVVRKITAIAKKCGKSNVPFTFTVSDPYDYPVHFADGKHLGKPVTYLVSFTDIEVDCQFRYNGWKALGYVQRKEGIVQCYFDTNAQELIRQYKETDFHCDHCHKRVYRNSVAILENESTNERKVVGTSCVKEFTCGLDGNLIAQVADLSSYIVNNAVFIQLGDMTVRDFNGVTDLDEEWFSERGAIGRANCGHEVKRVVSCAASLIREYGFHSSQEFEKATWKFILDTMDKYNTYVTEDDEKEAENAINWILGLSEDEQTKSSYIFNLYQICKSEYCSERHFGFLASLIPAYHKANVQKKVVENKSNYIGSIGEKITREVTITKRLCFDSIYGSCWIILMKDNEGNTLKWKTSKCLDQKYVEGCKTTVTGTIKEYEEYRGEKQTALTRCKFAKVADEEETIVYDDTEKVDAAMDEFMAICGG